MTAAKWLKEATKKGIYILKPHMKNLKFSDCILVLVHSRKYP